MVGVTGCLERDKTTETPARELEGGARSEGGYNKSTFQVVYSEMDTECLLEYCKTPCKQQVGTKV